MAYPKTVLVMQIQDIPTDELITRWHKCAEWLGKARIEEAILRKGLAERLFPDPVEGSRNKVEMMVGDRPVIAKLDHKINRSVDEATLDAVVAQIREELDANFDPNDVIKRKPELKVGPYKKLDTAIRQVLDTAITAKPGSGALTIEGL